VTPPPAYIVAMGAVTPIGRSSWASAAAARAGIAGFSQHPFMIDVTGAPMIVARASWLDIELMGTQRLQQLLFPAIDQVLETRAAILPDMRTAIALALPSPRPGLSDDCAETMLAAVRTRYPAAFTGVAMFPSGHAGGLLAVEAACRKLAGGGIDACVVAGVDSYLQPETLEWLEANDQLHGAGPLNNAWGFIPGEAAAAVLVVRADLIEQFRESVYAQILSVATATETRRIKTETVCIGEGLTQAFRGALAPLPEGERVTDVYCDMNGEPYRADEYGFTCLRTKEYFQSSSAFVAPADCWGDVAAASAPLCMVMAAIAGTKGYANGGTSFVWASSESGERGAAVLRVKQGDMHAG
jgi:3-oxoacyl-[acyl-carrier-protein] synthase I